MSVAMIVVDKTHRSTNGDLLIHFRHIDSITLRPAGEVFVSSPVIGIETVKDSNGTIQQKDEASVVLRTKNDSVYFTVMDKMLANQIQYAIINTPHFTKKIKG